MSGWRNRLIGLAQHVAKWSKDPSTKVGCVIADSKHHVRGIGFNGFPRGVDDTEARLTDRPTKYLMVQHAETNAVLNATESVEGCTAYVTHPPCSNCAGVLIQAGIARVVAVRASMDGWSDSFDAARAMMHEAGVDYVEVENGK